MKLPLSFSFFVTAAWLLGPVSAADDTATATTTTTTTTARTLLRSSSSSAKALDAIVAASSKLNKDHRALEDDVRNNNNNNNKRSLLTRELRGGCGECRFEKQDKKKCFRACRGPNARQCKANRCKRYTQDLRSCKQDNCNKAKNNGDDDRRF